MCFTVAICGWPFTLENNENTPLYGATQAMILAGQKDAKKRVFLFFAVYVITGSTSEFFVIFLKLFL